MSSLFFVGDKISTYENLSVENDATWDVFTTGGPMALMILLGCAIFFFFNTTYFPLHQTLNVFFLSSSFGGQTEFL
jgi:hypothetical protein